jgi:hypothetical protein
MEGEFASVWDNNIASGSRTKIGDNSSKSPGSPRSPKESLRAKLWHLKIKKNKDKKELRKHTILLHLIMSI